MRDRSYKVLIRNAFLDILRAFQVSVISLRKIKYSFRCHQIAKPFLPLKITLVVYHCRMPFCHFLLACNWLENTAAYLSIFESMDWFLYDRDLLHERDMKFENLFSMVTNCFNVLLAHDKNLS